MKDLFLPDKGTLPEGYTKVAEREAHFVSADSASWVKEVIVTFLQKFPSLQNEELSITWTKLDQDKGYAVGSLNVLGGGVPVIIKEYRLSPLDVIIFPELTLPLNDYFLEKLFKKPEAFKALADSSKKSHQALFGTQNALQFSPNNEYGGSNGSRVTRDAVKVASVIDKLTYIDPQDAKELLLELKDPIIKQAYEENGNLDIFSKIAQKSKEFTKTAGFNNIIRSLDTDRQMVYSDEFGNHFVKQANSRVNKAWITKISSQEAQELEDLVLNKEISTQMEKSASFYKFSSLNDLSTIKGQEISVFCDDLGETPLFTDFYVDSVEKVAEQVKVAEFNVLGTEKTLRIDEEARFTLTNDKLSHSMSKLAEFSNSEPRVGDFGVFIGENGSTLPIEITSMIKMAGIGNHEITGEHGMNFYKFYPIPLENSYISRHDTEKNAFYIPKEVKFVKLAGRNDKLAALKDFEAKIKITGLNGLEKVSFYLTDSETSPKTVDEAGSMLLSASSVKIGTLSEHIEKTASFATQNDKVLRDKAGLFSFYGSSFEKYAQASSTRNLNDLDAKWTAIHCGATLEDLEKLSSLHPGEEYSFIGKLKAPITVDEFQNLYLKKEAESPSKKLKISKNLVKCAAFMRDKSTVDAVLSLGVMRNRNIMEYLAALPTYETVLGELGKLLIASRLGLPGISPDSVKEALEALAQAVMELHALQATVSKIK